MLMEGNKMKKRGIALLAAALLLMLTLGTALGEEANRESFLLDELMAELEAVAKLMQTGAVEESTGTIAVLNLGEAEVRPGDLVVLTALVDGAAAGFTVRWEMLDLTEYVKSADLTPWQVVGYGEMYRMVAEESLSHQSFRAVLCLTDGREVVSEAMSVAIAAKDDSAVVSTVVQPLAPVIVPDADELISLDEVPAENPPALDELLVPLKTVAIEADCPEVLRPGDVITLRGVTVGFEGEAPEYQWECDKGQGFETLEEETEATCTFTVSADSLTWRWRLTVRDL